MFLNTNMILATTSRTLKNVQQKSMFEFFHFDAIRNSFPKNLSTAFVTNPIPTKIKEIGYDSA